MSKEQRQKKYNDIFKHPKIVELIKSRRRVRDHGEVMTPFKTVADLINMIPDEYWQKKGIKFPVLEDSCGSGNILLGIILKKLDAGLFPIDAINSTWGVDICPENIAEARDNVYDLIKGSFRKTSKEHAKAICIIHHNIFVVEDTLSLYKEIESKDYFCNTNGHKKLIDQVVNVLKSGEDWTFETILPNNRMVKEDAYLRRIG